MENIEATVIENIETAKKSVKKATNETATKAKATVKETAKTVKTAKAKVEKVEKNVEKEAVKVKAAATKTTETIKAKATELVEDVKEMAENVSNTVEETVETAKKEGKNKLAQAVKATKATNKIIVEAGSKILKKSIDTTKNLATIYKSAGTQAMEIGKNVLDETIKLATDNKNTVVKTSVKAFKDTVDTLRDSNLIAVPTVKATKKGKK